MLLIVDEEEIEEICSLVDHKQYGYYMPLLWVYPMIFDMANKVEPTADAHIEYRKLYKVDSMGQLCPKFLTSINWDNQ